MRQPKKLVALATAVGLLLSLAAPASAAAESDGDTHTIVLSSTENEDGAYTHTATCDGERVTEYDYTWSIDPGSVEDNAPAETYSGDEPGDEAVYIAHDIYYYPELDEDSFALVNYDGDQEWAYYYTAEGYEDFIFSTLPYNGGTLPTSMMHSADEAYYNAVLHITQAGTYYIEGEWHGQIWIDLGDDADTDEDAKVTIILNGVDVTCTVAPALVFYSVYECDQDQTSGSSVDTSQAGARVVIADGTENNFTGENVYRILKAQYKSGSTSVQKKLLKQDGAFYSYMTMEVDGEDEGTGVLNIEAGFEGLDSDMHLTINGGNINISSQDDGVNTSEDGISVFTMNDGSLHILAGLGADGGDGVDSNGYLVINGGTVISMASPQSDSGLDSDSGSYINGGTVVALGSTMDGVEADDTSASSQVSVNLQFSSAQSADEAIIITDTDGNVVFAYDPDQDEVAGDNARSYQGAILSCEALTIGESYYIYVGGDVYGEETQGVYDASTVTGFSSDAKQQCYTGTGTSTAPGGDGGAPDGGSGGPDSGDGSGPDGGSGGGPGGSSDTGSGISMTASGEGTASTETASITFTMSEQVNSFSGVTDYDGGDSDADTDTDTDTDSNTGADASGGFDSTEDSGTNEDGDSDDTTGSGSTHTHSYAAEVTTPATYTSEGVMTYTCSACGASYTETIAVITSSFLFDDVQDASASYYGPVYWAYDSGITTGTTATTFSPSKTCTRAQFVTFLWRLAGEPEPESSVSPFTDVTDTSASYYYAVLWAVEQGVTKGTSATTFSPSQTITRAQAVTMLYRYAGEPAVSAGSSFTDVTNTSAFYYDAVQWAVQNGITNGTSDTTFSPSSPCTRGQMVTFLYRFAVEPLSV